MPEHTAVVSGVSKGLGAALAAVLLEHGIHVVGIGRSASAALERPGFRLVHADLSQTGELPAVVDALFDELAAQSPQAITVVNNAAVASPAGVIGSLDPTEMADAIAVNLHAPAIIANAFVRTFAVLPGDRRLVNVSSGAAAKPLSGAGTYCFTKAGLEMLTQAVAAEQGPNGITAITIRPGIIDTPMQVFLRGQPADTLPSVDLFRGFHEEGRLLPAEITATKIVERLVLAPIVNGHTYNYAEL